MRLAIRADGTEDMGFGHLLRADTVGREFLSDGSTITLLTPYPEAATQISDPSFEIHPLPGPGKGALVDALEYISPDATLMDLPHPSLSVQRAIRERSSTFALYLGSARTPICCDILVNSHPFAEEEAYKWLGEEPTWCLGLDYLPLRREFREFAARDSASSNPIQRVIVLMGASDPDDLTSVVMEALARFCLDVVVVVGPGHESPEAVSRKADQLSGTFHVLHDPSDLGEQMFQADFAITGFGNTIYELMATGTPFLGIARTELERATAQRLQSRFDIPAVGPKSTIEELASFIRDLLDDSEKLGQLGSMFSQSIDGRGAERICREIRRRTPASL